MDTPSTRSLKLLALLQSGGQWGGRELADQLQVSERTVRRDAMRLRDLGYDVGPSPRIVDTVLVDYAAVGSVAARWAS